MKHLVQRLSSSRWQFTAVLIGAVVTVSGCFQIPYRTGDYTKPGYVYPGYYFGTSYWPGHFGHYGVHARLFRHHTYHGHYGNRVYGGYYRRYGVHHGFNAGGRHSWGRHSARYGSFGRYSGRHYGH